LLRSSPTHTDIFNARRCDTLAAYSRAGAVSAHPEGFEGISAFVLRLNHVFLVYHDGDGHNHRVKYADRSGALTPFDRCCDQCLHADDTGFALDNAPMRQ